MYQCVCHTCEESTIEDDLERAQEYFNEHADRRCAVEILNVELAVDSVPPEPSASPSPGTDVQPRDE